MKSKVIASTIAALFVGTLIVPLAAHAKVDVADLIGAKRVHAATVEKAPSAETVKLCPVSGMKADKATFLTHEGRKINFCCGKCEEPFLKNPDKYLEKGEKSGRKGHFHWSRS